MAISDKKGKILCRVTMQVINHVCRLRQQKAVERTYLRCGQKSGKVLWCMSDNTRNHQTGDEGRTLSSPGKTELDYVKDT
jgi:hypothetical protein